MSKVGMFALVMVLAGSTALSAKSNDDKQKKAQEKVDRIREADPPKVKERQKDDTAQKRSNEANAQEKATQKETAKKYPAKGRDVPSPK